MEDLVPMGAPADLDPTAASIMMLPQSMEQPIAQPMSPSNAGSSKPKKKKKKMKHLQIDLEPHAHQKLMRIISEQHGGSLESFLEATVSTVIPDRPNKRYMPKKPAVTKWKRIKFDQLKGNDTQELAAAYKQLAETTTGVELTPGLAQTPWDELTIPQLERMLEETKKMLLSMEKVHDCPHAGCGRRFVTPGNLRDHMNEHSGEKPYACTREGCMLQFHSKQLLCRHMKEHERSYTCQYEGCGKRFAFRERLVVHQKIHSDERPLTCPWEGCGKTFKWANSLHGHMRTHTGEKPFQCTFAGCGRLFGYKVDLTRHVRTHYGQPARLSH
eukprot:TRINITY_DN17250_c0_g1_i1.p1 TRINITY_DN17250_c0_g1~~TRINITY_DN17250_c0_g1_i1.p1  ORF type:complete len:328 (-),score=51.34 TRINITY_DN17250_c0_g1_i1:424-1407(-)